MDFRYLAAEGNIFQSAIVELCSSLGLGGNGSSVNRKMQNFKSLIVEGKYSLLHICSH